MRHARSVVLVCAVVAMSALAVAQAPEHVVNARLQVAPASGGLAAAFDAAAKAQAGPLWIGYEVPIIAGRHHMCCGESYVNSVRVDCGPCRLERDAGHSADENASAAGRAVQLEGAPQMKVLYRVQNGAVGRIAAFSGDCTIDAGGLPLVWLSGVSPAESASLLSRYVHFAGDREDDDDESVAGAALMAIAFHADASAEQALARFIAPTQPERLREKTAFWLGVARGQRGFELLRGMVHDDPAPRVRDKAVFALAQSRVPEAVPTMIDVARRDSSPEVRGQALFWLAQKAGEKAAAAIANAVREDPETEVKKKAVFALSQLPRDEGVPLLIEVARQNANPEVRKQAIFWLGQARDPRALTFFEQVLNSR